MNRRLFLFGALGAAVPLQVLAQSAQTVAGIDGASSREGVALYWRLQRYKHIVACPGDGAEGARILTSSDGRNWVGLKYGPRELAEDLRERFDQAVKSGMTPREYLTGGWRR